jgi:ectoine hydroxylase-related dioxygenase (phytanoyl-CoA dioxygenase family)
MNEPVRNAYGSFAQTGLADALDAHAEEIRVQGYTILEGLYGPAELETWRRKIDATYAEQEGELGREFLASIRDADVCRAPLLRDFDFAAMAAQPTVMELVRRMLGDWFILNLQNAIINRPGLRHDQSAWHRDLPHQNFVISKPIAISVLFAIDDFSEETGGTHLVPFTHRTEVLPSQPYIDRNAVIATAKAGAAIVFDSMLFHRAGANRSPRVRRAVNHVYTIPIMKQNYDFPRALGPRRLEAAMERLLGYTSQVPLNEKVWREGRVGR